MDWKEQVDHELNQAQAARARGNEGMARVCARRAAGIAIGVFLAQRGLAPAGPSAYDRLRYVQSLTGLSPRGMQAAERLTLRVNEAFTLPAEVDLIAEARLLVDILGLFRE